MSAQPVYTRTAKIFIDENDILVVETLANVEIDDLDVLDNLLVIRNLTKGEKKLKLIDLRAADWTFKAEGKKTAKENVKPNETRARAILIHSTLEKQMKNFFSKLSAPNLPQKYFTNKKDAIAWLKSF